MKWNRFIFDNMFVRLVVFALAVAGVIGGFDPVRMALDYMVEHGMSVEAFFCALAIGAVGYLLLEFGGSDVIFQASGLVTRYGWNSNMMPGIIALGTSLSEAGLVTITTVRGENEILAYGIVTSDSFQIGGLFFTCVLIAKSLEYRAKGLRWALTFLTLMSAMVLQGMFVGFTWPIGILICFWAGMSIRAFLRSAPDGTFELDDVPPGLKVSWYRLATDFGSLLLGTLWFLNAVEVIGGLFGVPTYILGIVAAIITSLPESFTTIPLIKRGKKGLFYATIALAGSNAFDTGFLGVSTVLRPFALEFSWVNVIAAGITVGLSFTMLALTYRKDRRIPRWTGAVIVPAYMTSFVVMALIRGV